VGCSNICSGYKTPLSIIAEFGKFSRDNSSISVRKDAWDVLQQDVLGSYLANAPSGIGPEVSLVCCPFPFSCVTVWLARESCRNDVSQSSIESPVEGTYITDDWGVVEVAVCDSCLDDFLDVLVIVTPSYRSRINPGYPKS
jgi:hypothetical protein